MSLQNRPPEGEKVGTGLPAADLAIQTSSLQTTENVIPVSPALKIGVKADIPKVEKSIQQPKKGTFESVSGLSDFTETVLKAAFENTSTAKEEKL